DWSEEKHALEWLFAAGEVTVAGRRGFERLYDLPERVLPATLLEQAQPNEAEAHRGLLLHAAVALGVATEQDLRDYFRLSPQQSKAALAVLVEDGRLQACTVQGWKQPAYVAGVPRVPRRIEASALLSPFDSLVWARERTERLFDFRYRLEIYTPAHKRVYGYYVLPFLYRERIAARVDLRAERAHGRLAVHAVHEEPAGLDGEGYLALAANLQRLAAWLGLERVQLNCPRAEGSRLRQALLSGVPA
ncbi:winged helix DNA-binding domain-containing protein, partial [Pseudomonas mosselii]